MPRAQDLLIVNEVKRKKALHVTEPIVFALIVVAAGISAGAIFLARAVLTHPQIHFNWFVLHFAIGALGIIAILILAILNDLTAAATAVIASVVAYSLGITAQNANNSTPASTSSVTNPSQSPNSQD